MALEMFENSNRFLERAVESSRKFASLGIGSFPHRVIHRENKLRVLLYQSPNQAGTRGGSPPLRRDPILLIPSLINRHYILDLLPGKSLVEFLTQRGYQVAMIDWGAPGDEDRDVPLDRYLDGYLKRAIRATCTAAGADRAILGGYCLGGTMALAHAALHPESVSGLILMTAPVNFHNDGILSAWCRTPSYDVETMVTAFGNVPWALMQTTFQWLRPTLSATRQIGLWRRLWDDEFVDGFYALEAWANDNVSFPGRCYREFIQRFYHGNALVNGSLTVSGRRVDLERISHPVLNVVASEDHIVPADATAPLRSILAGSQDVTELKASGGHIGAIVSKRASYRLWPELAEWLDARVPLRTENVDIQKSPAFAATASASISTPRAGSISVSMTTQDAYNAPPPAPPRRRTDVRPRAQT